ncbi:MAG: hypothetical protein AUJ92_07290 [Armatimonadetes bacterium CG2_30_59_28]|nr:hypothetical protein [Armatimonadota bacterium]OIO95891.1 MAG: hypothetical protein AUJ92_07290 [Armatimonadetes bacterium CG2_30_59_28]PIX41394.1 MAG: hypothetical protein COZ56_12250 [Armatimonadetes bacterium CG_4_8_14_3_um_filter_58_9]
MHYAAWQNHGIPFKHQAAHPQHLWLRMADIVHPNALGHLAMFRELAPVFGVSPNFPWEEVSREPA